MKTMHEDRATYNQPIFMDQSAFILRISPSEIDKVPEALESDQIIIGWAYAAGLLDPSLGWQAFRKIVSDVYYKKEPSMRRAGSASGHMWRFVREMNIGDFIVVPHGNTFYVAEVTGLPVYLKKNVEDDTAYRRAVKWLNGKKPLSRGVARSALLSRMKVYGTTADASDLLGEIKECLALAKRGETPTSITI